MKSNSPLVPMIITEHVPKGTTVLEIFCADIVNLLFQVDLVVKDF